MRFSSFVSDVMNVVCVKLPIGSSVAADALAAQVAAPPARSASASARRLKAMPNEYRPARRDAPRACAGTRPDGQPVRLAGDLGGVEVERERANPHLVARLEALAAKLAEHADLA